MTKMHFQRAAEQVHAILDGHWTDDLPDWAHGAWNAKTSLGQLEIDTANLGNIPTSRIRAIWTAEAYLQLFSEYNPRFDRSRFLRACGLEGGK